MLYKKEFSTEEFILPEEKKAFRGTWVYKNFDFLAGNNSIEEKIAQVIEKYKLLEQLVKDIK